ncbi:predicted protein [Chaetoceros tenuissimus]|uniref:RING-type domain-containing protein n=1 Tax=Chaetoceros tenuissimus TaxID=426638 RepID=A0AAD3D3G8_9STRA|nr:predicted protein [Chaetoceros tenuissimus]
MPTITFRLFDDDDEGQKKSAASSTSSKSTRKPRKNRKKQDEAKNEDPSSSQDNDTKNKLPLIKKEEDADTDDVVIVSETSPSNGASAISTTGTASQHNNNSKKSAFMRRMEELTRNAAAARTSGNQQTDMEAVRPSATNTTSPLPSKRKRMNAKETIENIETSKKQRKKRQPSAKDSSKNATANASFPLQDEESFYMNCTDEELERWLKEKYKQKAERIREQLKLQMKEELKLLQNKRSLAKLLANDDITSLVNQPTQTKMQPTPKQTKPAKTPRTSTSPKQGHASTSPVAGANSSASQQMIDVSTGRKSCPTCKSFCKAIFASKSGCGHKYCEACVVVASFSSNNGQDDANSNSQNMTKKPPSTPVAVSLASTCTKSTSMQTHSTQGSSNSSVLSIPVPSSCPICHILECQPNKPPPIENVVAVKPKRKNPYVPEWTQTPKERQSPPRTHIASLPQATGTLKNAPPTAPSTRVHSASSYLHQSASRNHNVDRSKQDEEAMDKAMQMKLQSERERGEMLQYLLSQEKSRKTNPQSRHNDAALQQNRFTQYPPSHPYHPYFGRF